MARPRKLAEDAKNVSLNLSEKDWDLFLFKAKSMGLSRSELVAKIGRGEIPLGQENKVESI